MQHSLPSKYQVEFFTEGIQGANYKPGKKDDLYEKPI